MSIIRCAVHFVCCANPVRRLWFVGNAVTNERQTPYLSFSIISLFVQSTNIRVKSRTKTYEKYSTSQTIHIDNRRFHFVTLHKILLTNALYILNGLHIAQIRIIMVRNGRKWTKSETHTHTEREEERENVENLSHNMTKQHVDKHFLQIHVTFTANFSVSNTKMSMKQSYRHVHCWSSNWRFAIFDILPIRDKHKPNCWMPVRQNKKKTLARHTC